MHEYSIVQALLARVEEEAHAHSATAVHRLSVRIGELSGVEPRLLASAYEVFRERSVCEGADLVIESIPARWVCPACDATIDRGAILACAVCGGPALLAQGDEILLERIEMEVP